MQHLHCKAEAYLAESVRFQSYLGLAVCVTGLAATISSSSAQELNSLATPIRVTSSGGPPPPPPSSAKLDPAPLIQMPSSAAFVSPPQLVPALPAIHSKEEKPIDWFARILGATGLILAIANLGFALWKFKRDRRLSIDDDFWFRKVLTPATIDPMLKGMVSLLESLPSVETPSSDRAAYALRITTEFGKTYSSMQTLALFGENLPTRVCNALRVCEDILTEHSAGLADSQRPVQTPATELQAKVWSQVNAALRIIRDHQFKQ